MEFYTEIKVTIRFPDSVVGPRQEEYIRIKEQWDPSLEDLEEMFKDIVRSMGYSDPT